MRQLKLGALLLRGYRWWGFYATPIRPAIRSVMADYMARVEPQRVLELGGGNGLMRKTLSEGTTDFLCTDIAPTDATDMVVDGRELPFADSSYDLIAAFEVLEHVAETDMFLAECHRVLVPGGHLALSVPFMYGLHDFVDYYRFTPQGIDWKFREHGFSLTSTRPISGTFTTLVVLLANWLRQLVIKERSDWRATKRERLAIICGAAITAPLTPAVWLAVVADKLFDPRSATPVGFIFIATRDDSRA